MMDKLKAKRDALVEEEVALVSKLEKVQSKISIVEEMIAEESSKAVSVDAIPVETPVAEKTIEFGALPRSF